MTPGSVLVQSQWGLIVQPKSADFGKLQLEKLSCLWAAIGYANAKGDALDVKLIGNEAAAQDE